MPSATIWVPWVSSTSSSATTSSTVDVLALAVPHDGDVGRGQQRELVEGPLGPPLLVDADAGVGHEHDAEQGVLDRPDGQDDDQQRAEDGVEAGEDVGPDDLPQRTGWCRPGARLTRPSATRAATSAAVRPVGSADRVTLGAVTARRVPSPCRTEGSDGNLGRRAV